MAKIDFIKALKTIDEAVPYITTISLGIVISVVIVGVVLYAVSNGDINVATGISDFLTNFTTTVVSFFTTLGSGLQLGLSLLAVVVILALFGAYVSRKGRSKGNGNKF